MKKLLYISYIFLGFTFLSTTAIQAQNFQVEGGAAYGLEVEAVGIQAGALYTFTENIRAGADLIYFFPESPGNGDYSIYEINLNGHYLFLAEPTTSVYALAGINYITSKVSGGGISASASETGLNLGGGAEFGVGFGALYVEAKYVLSSFNQLSLGGGVRFSL